VQEAELVSVKEAQGQGGRVAVRPEADIGVAGLDPVDPVLRAT
jgi:hypothetical protein